MIAQRPPGAAAAVQGSAEHLPFADHSFDAVMAILTIHHWSDKARGLRELRRVARQRVVILTYDPAFRGQWQTRYWPGLIGLDDGVMPPLAFFGEHLGPVDIAPVMVPHDCTDGFLYAYWRRPQAYLDPRIRKGSSGFWLIDGVEEGARRLEADLASGTWHEAHHDLVQRDSADMGYRLITATFG
jgi:SAM-dependent methyltransferase